MKFYKVIENSIFIKPRVWEKEGFYSIFFKTEPVRFFRFFTYKTETEPNQPVFLKF